MVLRSKVLHLFHSVITQQRSGCGIKITAVGQKADTGLPGKLKYQPLQEGRRGNATPAGRREKRLGLRCLNEFVLASASTSYKQAGIKLSFSPVRLGYLPGWLKVNCCFSLSLSVCLSLSHDQLINQELKAFLIVNPCFQPPSSG